MGVLLLLLGLRQANLINLRFKGFDLVASRAARNLDVSNYENPQDVTLFLGLDTSSPGLAEPGHC